MGKRKELAMKPDRVIKLPVFRTMFCPVAQKEWKCCICKEPVEIGKRYVHYFDRRVHEIKDYRFHMECFGIVEAYCAERKRNAFTPVTVRKWALNRFCMYCPNDCALHPCKRIESAIKTALKGVKKKKTP